MSKIAEIILIGILFPLTIGVTFYELNWIDKKNEKRIEYHQKIISNLKEIRNIIDKEKWKISYEGIITKPLDNIELHKKIFEGMINEKYYNIYLNDKEKVEIIRNIAGKIDNSLKLYTFFSWTDFAMKDNIVDKYDNNVENNEFLKEEIFNLYHELSKEIKNAEKKYFEKMNEYINSTSIEKLIKSL